MLVSLLLSLAQVTAPSSPSQSDIIVTGRRAEQELAACLARSCPPAEEVEASLQASVEQFAAGRYDHAQHTLQRAIKRNRDYAAKLPGPVSSLYATLATVAEHEGDNDLWLSSARNNVLVLQRHLGATHDLTLRQELVLADNLLLLRRPSLATAIYEKVQQKAVERGKADLAADSAFRRAWLLLLTGEDENAESVADEAVRLAGDRNPVMLELHGLLRARIAIRRGDDGAVDALAAQLRQSPTEMPKLLFAPAVEDINIPPQFGMENRNPIHDSHIRFADIGFWVRPDGRTAGVEVLRNNGLGAWAPGILRHFNRRRYIPLDVEQDKPGIYRIDRVTVRATIGTPTGSRISRRMGNLSVHIIDLTETDNVSAVHRERTREALSQPTS